MYILKPLKKGSQIHFNAFKYFGWLGIRKTSPWALKSAQPYK